ncbi:DUF4384 domain-containing protein [Ruegeria lacuscaerulensis]|uniref:DUF4384 domain-containing protein n=1 Tax=Ruegeria lacuscaerulensis TaxID=55218 RepID=UPI00147E8308|nr:DUF4384 domain-containing protein [Ruegeria lacuscaerulensis]
MIRGTVLWGIGLVVSLALHVGGAIALIWSVEPEPVDEQPVPETQMQLSAHRVKQSEAVESQPDSETAQTEDASGAQLGQSTIRQSTATAAQLPQQLVAVTIPETDALSASEAKLEPAQFVSATSQPLQATTLPASQLVSAAVQANPVSLKQPLAQAVPLAQPTADVSQSVQLQPVVLTQTVPDIPQTAASEVFSTSGDGPIDPVSLAAIQSFMQPEDAGKSAENLRDGIDGLLAQVPCARLQVQFQPDTNTLQLIGHIPEDGLRNPVLAALQTQMGSNIQVEDKLRILPRPQCGALSGIADIGLPQSTDQITNPLLIGEDVHARAFRYVNGQQLVLDLTGADYDAYVYVDYFDAQGQVIHLRPNESTPMQPTLAMSALRVGAAAPGDPGLFITIGPPYGQEIAVAFAASDPLYQEDRPLIEPADAYLKFLKSRVAEARAVNPDFKGEWVYFFITTAER